MRQHNVDITGRRDRPLHASPTACCMAYSIRRPVCVAIAPDAIQDRYAGSSNMNLRRRQPRDAGPPGLRPAPERTMPLDQPALWLACDMFAAGLYTDNSHDGV